VANAPTQLRIAIPGGFVAAVRMDGSRPVLRDAGTFVDGQVFVAAAGTTINIERDGGAAFTNTGGGNNTNVVGEIEFEVQ